MDRVPRYMAEDLDLRGIGLGALVILVAIGCALVGAYLAVHLGRGGRASPELAAHVGKPPPIAGSITLQARPQQDIRAYMAEKRQLLDSYAWIDREHGIARIPIERAMALVAAGTHPGTASQ